MPASCLWLTLAALLAGAGVVRAQNPEPSAAPRPAAEGLYTEAQARRGEETYRRFCSECHVPTVFSIPTFRQAWSGLPVFSLYELIRTTMPEDNPGRLSPNQYAEVVAYLLQLNGVPAGAQPLPTDEALLRRLVMEFPLPK